MKYGLTNLLNLLISIIHLKNKHMAPLNYLDPTSEIQEESEDIGYSFRRKYSAILSLAISLGRLLCAPKYIC